MKYASCVTRNYFWSVFVILQKSKYYFFHITNNEVSHNLRKRPVANARSDCKFAKSDQGFHCQFTLSKDWQRKPWKDWYTRRRSAHYANTHVHDMRKKQFYNQMTLTYYICFFIAGVVLKGKKFLPPLRVVPNVEAFLGIIFHEVSWICIKITTFWLCHWHLCVARKWPLCHLRFADGIMAIFWQRTQFT